MSERADRKDLGLALAGAVAFGLYAAWGLSQLPGTVFDEVYTFPAARSIANGEAPFEQTHPPLSKLLMGLGFMAVRAATGAQDWPAVGLGSRLAAIVAGACAVAGLYLLVRSMADRRLPAVIATALLALDGGFYLLSRLAMTNVFGIAFTLWGVLGCWLALSRRQLAWLAPAGVMFGLAVACRHTAAVPLAICLGFALAYLEKRVRVLAALGLLPVLVYALTYAQTLWATGGGLETFFKLQQYSLSSHSGYSVPNLNASPWWSWPLMLAPPWYSFNLDPSRDLVFPVLLVGNALVWWAALPAIGYALWRWRDLRFRLLAALALGPWLMWAPLSSNASLMHYFLESIPPVCAILGLVIARWRPVAVFGYLGLALAWSVYFHPLQTGAPMKVEAYAAKVPAPWELGGRVTAFRQRMHLEDPKAYEAFNKKNYPTFDDYLKTVPKP